MHPLPNDPFITVTDGMAKRGRNAQSPILTSAPNISQAVSESFMAYSMQTVFAETYTQESFPHAKAAVAPKRNNRRPKSGEGEVARKPKAQRRKRRAKRVQNPAPFEVQAGPSGSTAPEAEGQQFSNAAFPQIQAASSYSQHEIGYTANAQEYSPFNSTSQTPGFPTDQLTQGYSQYNGDMASQALAFESADTLSGGYYAPLDFGGFHQLSTWQPSFPSASDQTGYGDLTAAAFSVNQGAFPGFPIGYDETRGAPTSKPSVSQASNQVVNKFNEILASFTSERPKSSYPNVPLFDQGQGSVYVADLEGCHHQPQPSHLGFDANGGSDLPNLTDEEFEDLISFVTREQNLQEAYLQPQGFVPQLSTSFN
jgi:hypothetical protein